MSSKRFNTSFHTNQKSFISVEKIDIQYEKVNLRLEYPSISLVRKDLDRDYCLRGMLSEKESQSKKRVNLLRKSVEINSTVYGYFEVNMPVVSSVVNNCRLVAGAGQYFWAELTELVHLEMKSTAAYQSVQITSQHLWRPSPKLASMLRT